jgi:hypothetical protein
MKNSIRCFLLVLPLTATPMLRAEPTAPVTVTAEPATSAGIKATALDYIEGWYTGDAARMESALHPDLAKRTPVVNPQTGRTTIQHLGAMALVQATRGGHGTKTPVEKRLAEITILDVDQDIANVKLVSADFIDWFQMAKVGDRWLIVNVIWTRKPKAN